MRERSKEGVKNKGCGEGEIKVESRELVEGKETREVANRE